MRRGLHRRWRGGRRRRREARRRGRQRRTGRRRRHVRRRGSDRRRRRRRRRRRQRRRRQPAVALVEILSIGLEIAMATGVLVAVVVPSNGVEGGMREPVASGRSERVVERSDGGVSVVLGEGQALVHGYECFALACLHVGVNQWLDRRRRRRRTLVDVRAADARGLSLVVALVPPGR